jgi:D-alanine transaminase
MSRIAYVNGQYVPHHSAFVHVEDRGYQFADGVYEVCAVADGLLLDETGHLDRLDRSLRELRIDAPASRRSLKVIMREMIRRNRVRDGIVYIQVSRGVAPRDHGFPSDDVPPSLVMTARAIDPAKGIARAANGIKVITRPDIRWKRPDIKSVSLLPNILAKQEALEAGAAEAWLVDENGFVTEGASTNAWIIDDQGRAITRDLGRILAGITRAGIIAAAAREGIELVEQAFTVEQAKSAREAFISAATNFAMPVIAIDGVKVGDGQPGPVTKRLRQAYIAQAKADATP